MRNMQIERLVAIIFLIIATPFLIIIMLIIIIDSKGNPIFKQNRVGKNGNIFIIYKLRTMILGVEPTNIYNSEELRIHEKYRVTKFGKYLRKTHIDEIPQLWNIFKGDMLFVGSRPLSVNIAFGKNTYIPRDKNITPGLTGLVQISHFRESEGYDTSKLDKFYFKNKSISLDLVVLSKTLYQIITNNQKHC